MYPAELNCWTAMSTSSLRSEEHTSELQSLRHLVCRLLLEKKKYHRISEIRYNVEPAAPGLVSAHVNQNAVVYLCVPRVAHHVRHTIGLQYSYLYKLYNVMS